MDLCIRTSMDLNTFQMWICFEENKMISLKPFNVELCTKTSLILVLSDNIKTFIYHFFFFFKFAWMIKINRYILLFIVHSLSTLDVDYIMTEIIFWGHMILTPPYDVYIGLTIHWNSPPPVVHSSTHIKKENIVLIMRPYLIHRTSHPNSPPPAHSQKYFFS